MTVGREISPECSTDERREWQNGGGFGHLVTPADWLARIHDPQHVCQRQLASCGGFLPHLLVYTARGHLGATSARPFPAVAVHRAIAWLVENHAPDVRNPDHMYHNTVQSR